MLTYTGLRCYKRTNIPYKDSKSLSTVNDTIRKSRP